MAEVVLSVAVETIFQQLGSFAFQEIGLVWGVNSQLAKLKNTLSTVKAVLLDAEEQQANNHEVRDWLEKLKDAVYDADDVLDEFQTEDLRRQVEIHGSMKKKIWDCEELNLLEGEGMEGLRALRSLSICGLPKLVALPQGLQQSAAISLQYLSIDNCLNLTTLPEWLKDLTSLLVLYIADCPNLLSLPEAMRCLSPLQELNITGCPHLSRRCKKETGEDWPKISHIPKKFIEDASEDHGPD